MPRRGQRTVQAPVGDVRDPDSLWHHARRYLEHLGVRNYSPRTIETREGACHLFRHTMATLMLEGGADIRFIQAMLGHVELSTTEIYTQVSIQKLKAIHTATHPGRIARAGQHALATELEATEEDLLEALALEAAEEDEG